MPFLSRWPPASRAETSSQSARGRADHDFLAARQMPAVAGLRRHGGHIFQREARLRLGVRQRNQLLAFGDFRQQRGLLLRRAERADQAARQHDGREIRLDDQRAADRLHDDADFDRAGAKPTKVFGIRQAEPAEIGQLAPDVAGEAVGALQDRAALFKAVAPGDEARCGFAKQPLFVGQRQVHDRSPLRSFERPLLSITSRRG